jgi:ArsR family metal-binding transcriptional regulator
MARLIKDYTLELYTPPCDSESRSLASIAHLAVDITTVLPLLNARLPGAVYHRESQVVTWKKGRRHIAFHPMQIAMANVEDREDAGRELDEIVSIINETWARRDQITPDFASHQRPVPMTIYKLLPRTNCKQCGESTCFNFALKLIAKDRAPEACPALLEAVNAESLAEIRLAISDVREGADAQ